MRECAEGFCIVFSILLPIFCIAQEWVVRYDGPANYSDQAKALAVDCEGNIYVTGSSWDAWFDYATIKYDSEGNEQWVARYTSPGNNHDEAYAIAVDDLGNVYVTGSIGSQYGTVKYNAAGVEQWVATYIGPGSYIDEAYAVKVDADNVYVTGRSGDVDYNARYATIKYDSSGVEQWVARYQGPGDSDMAFALDLDAISNIYVTGWSKSAPYPNDFHDYATVKYDAEGVEQWVARYDGPAHADDGAVAIVVDHAGNVYVTGASPGSSIGNYDYATVKYDSLGVEQWVVRYNGPGNSDDIAYAMAVDSAGNIYVTGGAKGVGTNRDYTTIKYDSAGIEQWVAIYNGPDSLTDNAVDIALDSDNNVYVTGRSEDSDTVTDYVTVMYDASGIEQWVARYDHGGSEGDEASSIATDGSGNVYVTGKSWGGGTTWDYATIKYSPTGIEESLMTRVKVSPLRATIFKGYLQLPGGKECKVFDITGRVVEPDKIKPGIYFIEVDGVVTQKVVKIR